MAIKVVIPSGTSTKTVEGLYQWDFGQSLEIECFEIGSEIVEVHFACTGMSEAIVRPCTFSDGIGTVVIPDQCLEQTSSITAWIYKIDSTQGHTIKTITLPISSRTRPCKTHDVPAEYVDKYNELIEEINSAVDAIENGDISVKKATEADHATKADSATNAGTASYATKAANADKATTADSAKSATKAAEADRATVLRLPVPPAASFELAEANAGCYGITLDEGIYFISVKDATDGSYYSGMIYVSPSSAVKGEDFCYGVITPPSGHHWILCYRTGGTLQICSHNGEDYPVGLVKVHRLAAFPAG